MNAAMHKAWLMWSEMDCMTKLATDYAKDAFEAGFDAAIAQSDRAPNLVGGAGSTPVVSTTTAEDIYATYPRRVGKQAAIKAIQKAGKGAGMDKLLKAVKAYAKATESWPEEDRKYIPHPATWFNRGSYDDDPKEWVRGTAPTSQFSQSH
jgi:hypothetical protein